MGRGSVVHRPLRAWHDSGHQRSDRTQGRTHRLHRERGLPRPAGDRPRQPARDLRHGAQAAGAGLPCPAPPAARRAGAAGCPRQRGAGAGRSGADGCSRRTGRARRACDRHRVPVLLPRPGAGAACTRADPGSSSAVGGVAVLGGRPGLPRVRACLRDRLRRLREAGARPVPVADGTGTRRGRRAGRSCSRAAA
jgi:hypothetical protein